MKKPFLFLFISTSLFSCNKNTVVVPVSVRPQRSLTDVRDLLARQNDVITADGRFLRSFSPDISLAVLKLQVKAFREGAINRVLESKSPGFSKQK